jgi:hypothetical protein
MSRRTAAAGVEFTSQIESPSVQVESSLTAGFLCPSF